MDAKVLVVFLIVLVLALCAARKVLSPGVRLVGGRWKGEGRVEIFFLGKWGTICHDKWDIDDAHVVCRQLGFPFAVSAPGSAHFGGGSGRIWMDDVECSGSEKSILKCPHNGWGRHGCNHAEDASVICSRVRLVGGSKEREGRVEIFYNDKWGTVSDDEWDMKDAVVVCRELGFPFAVSAPHAAHFGSGSGQVWLDHVYCSGVESSIADCLHRGWGVQYRGHNKDASVICSDQSQCSSKSNECSVNAICHGTVESNTCFCKPGYMGHGRSCSPNGLQDSVIVGDNRKNLAQLNKWLSLVIRSVNSRWIRCWRASVDGWAASTFHSRCDGKGPTVTIVRVGKYIFGGYTSVSWDGSRNWYQYDSKAFLFSLVNKPGWVPVKLPQTGKYSAIRAHSIYTHSSRGPTFGGGHDIRLSGTIFSSNLGYTYYDPSGGYSYGTTFTRTFLAGSYIFTPDEIETFYETF